MPFTPSHAVVALPFVRTPLVPAAIAAAAMAPDVPLFARIGIPYTLLHDVRWIPLTMAIALAMLLVWRLLLRPSASALLWRRVARRVPAAWDRGAGESLRETFGRRGGRWRAALWLSASLLLGALSHIVWDAFTHEGRFGVAVLPLLNESWLGMPGYRWMQRGTAVIALVVIACWLVRRLRVQRVRPIVRIVPGWVRVAWLLALPTLLIAATLWGVIQWGMPGRELGVEQLAYRVLPPACAVWGAVSIALCAVVLARRHALRTHSDTPGGVR